MPSGFVRSAAGSCRSICAPGSSIRRSTISTCAGPFGWRRGRARPAGWRPISRGRPACCSAAGAVPLPPSIGARHRRAVPIARGRGGADLGTRSSAGVSAHLARAGVRDVCRRDARAWHRRQRRGLQLRQRVSRRAARRARQHSARSRVRLHAVVVVRCRVVSRLRRFARRHAGSGPRGAHRDGRDGRSRRDRRVDGMSSSSRATTFA